jgi:hypothetical protein
MAVQASFDPAYGSGVTVTATSTSASSVVGAGSKVLLLTNLGAEAVYVRAGIPGITATLADYPVPAGMQVTISKFQDFSTIAYRTATNPAVLHIMAGEGY